MGNRPETQAGLSRRTLLAGIGGGLVLLARPAAAREERERHIRLLCPETGERFWGVYWQDDAYLPDAMRRIDWLMRDFHCEEAARMDPALIDLLHRINLLVGLHRPVHVLSGFRTRATNLQLRREGWPAAPESQHLVAHAADIRVEGVAAARLGHAAERLHRGGVGAYADYVHVDTGPVREWSGSRAAPRRHGAG